MNYFYVILPFLHNSKQRVYLDKINQNTIDIPREQVVPSVEYNKVSCGIITLLLKLLRSQT